MLDSLYTCVVFIVILLRVRRTGMRWGNTVNKNVGAVTYSEVSYEVAHIPICVAPTVPLFHTGTRVSLYLFVE